MKNFRPVGEGVAGSDRVTRPARLGFLFLFRRERENVAGGVVVNHPSEVPVLALWVTPA